LNTRNRLWMATSIGLLVALIVAALILPRSFGLTAFSDVLQCFLMVSGVLAFVPLIIQSNGRIRLFWILILMGVVFWTANQFVWTCYEVILRRDVPDFCTWDVVLFLHLVPMMAALALRPHVPRDEYAARLGHLDFALLLIWWLYLYVLIVIPWQYVLQDLDSYNRNLNFLYAIEKLALLAGLIACWIVTKGAWRKLYAGLFVMSLCYSASSTVANWAIGHNVYYTGSLYDIPMVISMASLTWIGLFSKVEKPEPAPAGVSTGYGIWVARFSMITAFSLPLFAAWSMSEAQVPAKIRVFRLGLTLLAAFSMGIMVFMRQRVLDRELLRLLEHSRKSYENLERLQAEILQTEKLASVTQLVGGAAHELNNPITAMLGYSDLLLSTQLTPEQQPAAAKIGQYVRRTRSLVASLISFARRAPMPKGPVDLNTLARTAVKLSQPQWEALEIEVRTQFEQNLPRVMGDSNQLLQVCLQLLANCLHVSRDRGGRALTLRSEFQSGNCVLQIATEAIFPADSSTESTGDANGEDLGLSACRGILQEHRGYVSCAYNQDGTVVLTVELPAANTDLAKEKSATGPVLWRSQPYA
jgi:signal transduction histidine kinase